MGHTLLSTYKALLRFRVNMGHTSSITVKNDTDITLDFELCNVYPYYWGTLKPGESATRYTGSWWFTVRVKPTTPEIVKVCIVSRFGQGVRAEN